MKNFMRDYRRPLSALLAAVATVAIAVRLGIWQLDRAAQKVALQTALETRLHLPALGERALARSPAEAAAQHFRPVAIAGRWVPERTVFLDNRQMDAKAGFFVVTPLRLEASAQAVLVQRGWVARNFSDRAALPAIATPAGRVTVEGSVAPATSRMFEFDAAASGPIRQNLDVPAFARESGLDLLPIAVVERHAAGSAPDGLLRLWPAPASDVHKHYGYAFQWFAIAAAIIVLYAWHRFPRLRKRRR